METAALVSSPFLGLIAYSAGLLLLHILLQASLATLELGLAWNASARDGEQSVKGRLAARAERALNNFKETYPAFIGLALALALGGDADGSGVMGAWIWMGCRIIYIPLYLAGIPYLRSLAWAGSIYGLIQMAEAIL